MTNERGTPAPTLQNKGKGSLRFGDHKTFHLQVLRITLAGAALGLIGHLVGVLVPLQERAPQAIWLALVATALGLAATPPLKRVAIPAVLLGLGIGLLGALSLQALALSPPKYPWFGMMVYGLAVGIIAGRDLKDFRRFLLPVATGLMVMVAAWAEQIFRARIELTQYIPSFLAEPVYFSIHAFLVSIAMVARSLHLENDPVAQTFTEIRPQLSGEMLELSDRAMTIYRRVQEALNDRRDQGRTEPNLAKAVESLVLRIFHLGRKWQEVEREAGRTSADELTARLDGLEKKIADSKDEIARKQYRMAKEALSSQLGYLRDISRNRERVTAQVHNHLAALERLHLAVLNHRGADTAKLSDEVQPILDEIAGIGHEMDFASEAIAEVEAQAQGEASFEPKPRDEMPTPIAAVPEKAEAPAASATVEATEPRPAAAAEAGTQKKDAESNLNALGYDE